MDKREWQELFHKYDGQFCIIERDAQWNETEGNPRPGIIGGWRLIHCRETKLTLCRIDPACVDASDATVCLAPALAEFTRHSGHGFLGGGGMMMQFQESPARLPTMFLEDPLPVEKETRSREWSDEEPDLKKRLLSPRVAKRHSVRIFVGNERLAEYMSRIFHEEDRVQIQYAMAGLWKSDERATRDLPEGLFNRDLLLKTFGKLLRARPEFISFLNGKSVSADAVRELLTFMNAEPDDDGKQQIPADPINRVFTNFLSLLRDLGLKDHPLVQEGERVLNAEAEVSPTPTTP